VIEHAFIYPRQGGDFIYPRAIYAFGGKDFFRRSQEEGTLEA